MQYTSPTIRVSYVSDKYKSGRPILNVATDFIIYRVEQSLLHGWTITVSRMSIVMISRAFYAKVRTVCTKVRAITTKNARNYDRDISLVITQIRKN